MTPHRLSGPRAWVVLSVAIVVLAVHVVAFRLVSSHLALPGIIAAGAIVVLLGKHLGAAAWVAGVLRRRRGR